MYTILLLHKLQLMKQYKGKHKKLCNLKNYKKYIKL